MTLFTPLKPKELVDKYFTLHSDNNKYVCTLCYPEWAINSPVNVKVYTATRHGYTWATQHLQRVHPDYNSPVATNQSLLISEEAVSTYEWICWIVEDNLPFTFCEKERVRCHTKNNLRPITARTLINRMTQTVEVIEGIIASKLPKTFGIAFDVCGG
mmetsp:Transcript_14939/g.21320  ORF Transcript_14939/g.21320 Transcript_14939/m.21320 type:complete len:157 (-) Transcript_14939:682-1152(-)